MIDDRTLAKQGENTPRTLMCCKILNESKKVVHVPGLAFTYL